jgi:hypothetical protein
MSVAVLGATVALALRDRLALICEGVQLKPLLTLIALSARIGEVAETFPRVFITSFGALGMTLLTSCRTDYLSRDPLQVVLSCCEAKRIKFELIASPILEDSVSKYQDSS